MTELAADAFRTDRAERRQFRTTSSFPTTWTIASSRIAVARVDDRLYAFDDLCTCADERCPLSGGLLDRYDDSCASATAPGSTSPPAP